MLSKPKIDVCAIIGEIDDQTSAGVEDVRRVAYALLDLCEAADPTEEESEWERCAAQQSREMAAETQEAERAPTVTPGIDPGALARAIHAALGSRGLSVRKPSQHHVQIMSGRKVFAEWWPSRGTTRANGQAGPRCRDEVRLVAWLRTLVP